MVRWEKFQKQLKIKNFEIFKNFLTLFYNVLWTGLRSRKSVGPDLEHFLSSWAQNVFCQEKVPAYVAPKRHGVARVVGVVVNKQLSAISISKENNVLWIVTANYWFCIIESSSYWDLRTLPCRGNNSKFYQLFQQVQLEVKQNADDRTTRLWNLVHTESYSSFQLIKSN